MDSQQFDDLTRALATGSSRRKVLKGLFAGVAGAVGLRRVTPANAATCRNLGEACRNDSSCCSGQGLFCDTVGTTGAQRCECDLSQGFVNCGGQCFSTNCPAGATFSCAGGCQCPSGSELCGATGSERCFVTCPTGQTRNPTTCACECPSSQELCNGACVTSCAGGQVLVNCVCQCPTGTTTCIPTGGTAQCTTNCTGGQVFNGSCQCVCPAGQELCGGQCVALCPTGQQRNSDCTCGCPTGTETCTPTGGTAQCVTSCTGGQVLNANCQCVCPTINGQTGIFCNGACHYDSECSGNKNFNAFCCSCQNPGQPSGRCK